MEENVLVEMNEKELLKEILEENKKRTFYARVAAIASVGTLAAVLICLLILMPRVNGIIAEADEVLLTAQSALAEVENAAVGLSGMSENIIAVSSSVNQFVADNSSVISEAMEQMNNIDYEGLNKAIKDLQDAVEPFAKFMNKFK